MKKEFEKELNSEFLWCIFSSIFLEFKFLVKFGSKLIVESVEVIHLGVRRFLDFVSASIFLEFISRGRVRSPL